MTRVQQLFGREDFAQLEAVFSDYRNSKSRTPSGVWQLSLAYAGVEFGMRDAAAGKDRDAAAQHIEDMINRWAQRYPDSPSPHIARSLALLRYAWAYRGNGFASTVHAEAGAPFFYNVRLARENLERYKKVAAVDPRWYEAMIEIAMAGWERLDFDSLLDEALTREPLFYQTYFAALRYLLPKWHGGTREIETFAQEAVQRTAKSEGRAMYARIYWYASQTQYGNALFAKSLAGWPTMRDSFDDIVAHYPDAWNLNHFAKFACVAHDKGKARELLGRIGSSFVQQAWRPAALKDQCLAWVASP